MEIAELAKSELDILTADYEALDWSLVMDQSDYRPAPTK